MPRQSEDLAAETAVMRSFDRALQATSDLPARAAGRVLRYVADRVTDELAANTGLIAGNGTVTVAQPGLGGGGEWMTVGAGGTGPATTRGGSFAGPGGSGGAGSVNSPAVAGGGAGRG